MSGLTLYTGNRLENLADRLAEVLNIPPPSPLTPEIILVQSQGMEKWLSLELARRLKICANIHFPFPNHFISGVFRQTLPDLEETPLFDPEIMAWRIMKILPTLLKEKGFDALLLYLSEGPSDVKLFQLSRRVADLFDQYLLFRPEMIFLWEKGKEDHWQAVLWREMVRGIEKKHRAALLKTFLEKIRRSVVRPETLPGRMAVFGISALPPFSFGNAGGPFPFYGGQPFPDESLPGILGEPADPSGNAEGQKKGSRKAYLSGVPASTSGKQPSGFPGTTGARFF
jgi:exodeoxyribonuclease V gamma subunit